MTGPLVKEGQVSSRRGEFRKLIRIPFPLWGNVTDKKKDLQDQKIRIVSERVNT